MFFSGEGRYLQNSILILEREVAWENYLYTYLYLVDYSIICKSVRTVALKSYKPCIFSCWFDSRPAIQNLYVELFEMYIKDLN